MTTKDSKLAQIRDAIQQRQHFVTTSHARPDGDAIGSQLAMAYALRALGKTVRIIDNDPAPPQFQNFPGIKDIEVASQVDGNFDAALVMECGNLSRTGVSGLEKYFVINIDHHPGNALYGAINWFDEGAAACGEMVFDLIEALGVKLTVEMATHVYIALMTDTGGFHFGHITPHSFEIARRCTEAGAQPEAIARAVYDSSTLGRLRLMGAVLHDLDLEANGRLALAHMSLKMLAECGATHEDSDGLINMPLTVKEIEAVAFFKEISPESYRISMRSKGTVDVNRVANAFGGGGHKNAAGCSMTGPFTQVRKKLLEELCRSLTAS
jgi:phosphoesterase RecJ-like protein